ncbi:MAG TPA: PAS domain-containing protein [Thermoleophilaceae bacterium]|nr:PAS domain-containing protein [Thermoleophilaceae bacterium]
MSGEQHPVELIMARGFMANLSTPAFLVDREGVLVFYNEAAEEILGLRFEEAGPMPAEEWVARFEPTGPDGESLRVEELPLGIALLEGRPAHAPLRVTSAAGGIEEIQATAFPVLGRAGQSGAIAIFWRRPL